MVDAAIAGLPLAAAKTASPASTGISNSSPATAGSPSAPLLVQATDRSRSCTVCVGAAAVELSVSPARMPTVGGWALNTDELEVDVDGGAGTWMVELDTPSNWSPISE